MKRTRLFVFPERTDFLLVYVPDGATFSIANVTAPMTKATVGRAANEAMLKAGIEFTISETVAGRWGGPMAKAMKDERAERRQRQMEAEAVQATILRSSNDPIVSNRAAAILLKQEVDERIRAIKDKIARAKDRAYKTGNFMPRTEFIELERELHEKQNESIAIQAHLRRLREDEKARNVAANRPSDKQLWNECVFKAARELLSPEMFETLKERAQAMVYEQEIQQLDAEEEAEP